MDLVIYRAERPITGFPGWSHYGASKAGQLGFLKTAAMELSRYNTTINAVMPGLTETGMAQQIYDQFDPKMGSREATMKVFSSGRSARPEEIADLIVYLASDRASFISGSVIAADRAQSA